MSLILKKLATQKLCKVQPEHHRLRQNIILCVHTDRFKEDIKSSGSEGFYLHIALTS